MDENDKPEASTSKLQSIPIDWQLLSSKLKFVPKDQSYCCESLTISSPKDDTNRYIYVPFKYLNAIKRSQTNLVGALLSMIFITCLLASIIYFMSLEQDDYSVGKIDTSYKYIRDSSKENQISDFEFKDINEDTLKMLYSFFPDDQIKNRSKRETNVSLKSCRETANNCDTMLESINKFIEILSKSEQFSIPLLQNLGFDISDTETRNSKLLEIIKCLECKKVVTENDEDNSMSDEDNDSYLQNDEYKNFQTVINLLEGKNDVMEEYDNLQSMDVDGKKEIDLTIMMNIVPEPIIKSSFVQSKRDNLGQTSDDFLTTLTNKPTDKINDDVSKNYETKLSSSNQVDAKSNYNWMPYPTCFYGLPPSPQSDINLPNFPASYSPIPYPPIPQQPWFSSQNQKSSSNRLLPNYLQIQAQNVQVLHPPNNIIPWLSVPNSKSSLTESGKTLPYYCMYVPPPPSSQPQNIGDVSDLKNIGKSAVNKNKIEHQRSCPANTYLCVPSNECFLNFTFCDGQVDCSDGSDEKYCNCTDRIMKDRLCDGYVDCPHGEDEMNCSECPKDYFSCYNFEYGNMLSRCIPIDKRCDGSKNCLNGKDEEDCNLLLPTYTNNMNITLVSYTEGYLHKNYKGTWYPVVSEEMSLAEEACKNELKLKNIDKPELEIRNVNYNEYPGTFWIMINNKVKIINSATSTIYVKCPPYSCDATQDNQSYLSGQYRTKNNVDIEQNKLSTNRTESMEENTILGIIGGRTSAPEAWPYLIAMYKDGNFHCGGVILNEYWILTAAHCLVQAKHYYEIQAGILRRLSFSPMTQNRIAKNIVIHPNYDPNLMKNDVGLVMLDTPLRFNRWVRPACLPEEKISGSIWNQAPSVDTMCVVLGWGALIEQGPDTDQLREVRVPILTNCSNTIYDNISEICAGYPTGGRDACQGDSGGPLLCMNPSVDLSYYVAGIVSHGEGCGRPGKPGIYTKVFYFLDWIKDISEGRMTNRIRGTPLVKCPGFSCKDGKCLPSNQQCDQKIHCLNGEDEENCNFWLDSQLFKTSANETDKYIINNENDNVVTDGSMINETTIESSSTEAASTTENIVLSSLITTSYTDITEQTSTSATTESSASFVFTCQLLLQNIHISKRCDKIIDCEDGTDEINCTCKDILSVYQPEAICNGYVDCQDKTDENNCNICSDDQFLCSQSKTCIPMSKKCDTKFDCPLKEDELDCFTLSNGGVVNLDNDGRPILNVEGVLTRIQYGTWHPTCHIPIKVRNQSSSVLIANNMCDYFGFKDVDKVEEVTILNIDIDTNVINGTDKSYYRSMPTYVAPSEILPTCLGLNIRCRPVPSSSINVHLLLDPVTGNRTFTWPWLAAIFVDGRYQCSAILLEPNWLLSSSACTKNIRLSENYTIAMLGYSPSFIYADGPYQQISIADDIKVLNDTGASLIHLKTPVNMTRHVQALFLEKRIYPPSTKDNCIAVGTDNDFTIHSIILRPVLKNCQKCHRCFVNAPNNSCKTNNTSNDWSGVVFCRGIKGWYPSAVFHEKNAPCTFQQVQALTSIDYLNAYLTQAMEDKIKSYKEPICDGIRCKIGQCVPWHQTCNGIQDCRDGSDEELKNCLVSRELRQRIQKEKCTVSELRCENGDCVHKKKFCDGKIDCIDGSDEMTNCSCASFLKLTSPERLCDGRRNCLDKTDESPMICPCNDNSFRCPGPNATEICIPQEFVCDEQQDCPGNEDEIICKKIRPFKKNTSGIGEVIQRNFGVWHSLCYPTPITTNEDASKICESLGYVSGTLAPIQNDTVPMVPIYDEFYIVRVNYQTWYAMRSDKPLVELSNSPQMPCHRAFVSCNS
ncbi:PREDICTED: serine protease nudel [Polistes canadensis]|uniref:serine protease nudel n=1 Tax=Polistes canadensis TaxID=91411 RepID=UPI000718D355|nr:PREDICTED: serine protease nudel [Polistes canadensis]